VKIVAILSALALSACAATTTQPGGAAPLPAASEFVTLAAPAQTFANPLAAAQHFAQYSPGYDGGSVLNLVSRRISGGNGLAMVFSVDGYADDSVRGEQWRIAIEPMPGGWRVTAAGRRFKCWRGGNPGRWQKELCS
jgi:hypothetical protein